MILLKILFVPVVLLLQTLDYLTSDNAVSVLLISCLYYALMIIRDTIKKK